MKDLVNEIKKWFFLTGMGLIPKNSVSKIIGRLVSIKLPYTFNLALIRWFIKRYNVNADEAEKGVAEYDCLQNFFSRKLKSGLRPISHDPNNLVSPCDGAIGQFGSLDNGLLLQVKGKPYSIGSLLGSDEIAKPFFGGQYATFYLSPRDYHRFHMPLDGRIIKARHIPGYLWPVNPMAVKSVDELFCVNERIVMLIKPAAADGLLAFVAVGATMVGKVHVNFDDKLVTNHLRSDTKWEVYEKPIDYKCGDELGRFAFGSTVVMAYGPNMFELGGLSLSKPVLLGEVIGKRINI